MQLQLELAAADCWLRDHPVTGLLFRHRMTANTTRVQAGGDAQGLPERPDDNWFLAVAFLAVAFLVSRFLGVVFLGLVLAAAFLVGLFLGVVFLVAGLLTGFVVVSGR